MAYNNKRFPAPSTGNELMVMPSDASSYNIDHRKWRVLVEAIFPNAKTAGAIVLALAYCKARGYDPFKRPVHIVPVWNSNLRKMVETVWPGINSLLSDAATTGAFAGMDKPEYGEDIARTFREYDEDNRLAREIEFTFPEWCRVTIYRMVQGVRCPFVAEVYWLEAYAKASRRSEIPNEMWMKRTRGQLAKCAQAAALRLAFPEAADYAAEEMEGKELPYGAKFAIDGEAAPVDESVAAEEKPVTQSEQVADAIVFRLDRGRVRLTEDTLWEKLVTKATADPEIASKLVQQNWSFFEPEDRKPLLDAMLQAMDRDTAEVLETFIHLQQEPVDEPVAA